jgi:hypothetical protein
VPTYTSPEGLEEVVRSLLKDDQRRSEISRQGSRLVAREHTFDHRAAQIVNLLAPVLAGRLKDLEGRRFDRMILPVTKESPSTDSGIDAEPGIGPGG